MISSVLPVIARRWLRRALAGALLPLLALPATAVTYIQSTNQNGSGDWNTLAHWNTAVNGSGSAPAAITTDDDFVGNTNGRILRTGTGVNAFGGNSLTLGPAAHVLNVRSSTSTSTIQNLITLGAPKVQSGYKDSNLAVTLWDNQSGTTTIINHTHSAALFPLTIGTLTGSGGFQLTGSATGLLRLGIANAGDYSGTITLAGGRLEFTTPVSSGGTLVVANPGDVILDQPVTFEGLVVGGNVYSPGTYTAAALGFAGSGAVTVGHSQTWYLTTKQSGGQNWSEAFLSNWNSHSNGAGVAPTSIGSHDDFVSQAAAGELRTLSTASTFGGGSLTLAHTSKLTLRTPANVVSTIPAFITAGTPTIANGIGAIRQNLALGEWENFSGTTRLSASAGRSLGVSIGNLTGMGGLQTHNGGSFFLRLANGSGYTGTLNHASGSLRFESPFATRGAFTVGSAETVHLDQPAYFTSFSVAGSAKPVGIHNYTTLNAQHPANFPAGSVSGLVGVYAPDATGPAQMFGVNLSGPETRNPANFPGTHGSQWSYPSAAAFDYYHARGLDLVRIPFRWERMQSALGSGVLNAAELARMDAAIALAAARDMKVVLVMHNKARWVPGSNHDGHLIGTGPVTLAHFAEVWRLLADHYKGNSAIHGYGIMDAPYDTNGTWPAIAQAAVNAIRTVDLGTYVLVSGDNSANAHGWAASNPNLDIQDPVGRLIYEARCFFDADGSGTYAQSYDASGASATLGVTRAT